MVLVCHITTTASLSFSLGFTFLLVHSIGLDKCIRACSHHYSMIQSSFTALKILCASPKCSDLKGQNERERYTCNVEAPAKFVPKFRGSSGPHLPEPGCGAGFSSSFCLSVKQMGFLLTPEYCERAGRGQATSSLPPSYPVYLFCTRLFWRRGWFQRVGRWGGLGGQ